MSEVEKKKPKRRIVRTPRDLVPIDKASGAGRFFQKMVNDIHSDLGGRRQTARITDELIEAFCGCATALRYQTHEILLGDAEIDMTGYATLASTMLRIGARLGLQRRVRDIPGLHEKGGLLDQLARERDTTSPVIDNESSVDG